MLKLFRNADSLSESQWLLLAKMIERHYSVRDAFEALSRTYSDSRPIQRISSGLGNGVSFQQLLSDSAFEKKLSFYVSFLPLDKSILIVNQQIKKEETLLKRFTGKMTYQLGLLAASFALMFLFTEFVMPTMLQSMSLNDSRTASISFVFTVLLTVRNLVIVLLLISALSVTYIKVRKRENYLWMFLHQHKQDRLLRIYATYRFVIRLNCLLENGISMIDAVNIIRQQKDERMTSLLAHHFNEVLLAGTDFEDSLDMSYFDDDFHSLCLLGLKSDDFCQSLSDYQEMIDIKFEQMLKKISMIIQIVCYGFVAAVIIMGYQVLLLPLEMVQEY